MLALISSAIDWPLFAACAAYRVSLSTSPAPTSSCGSPSKGLNPGISGWRRDSLAASMPASASSTVLPVSPLISSLMIDRASLSTSVEVWIKLPIMISRSTAKSGNLSPTCCVIASYSRADSSSTLEYSKLSSISSTSSLTPAFFIAAANTSLSSALPLIDIFARNSELLFSSGITSMGYRTIGIRRLPAHVAMPILIDRKAAPLFFWFSSLSASTRPSRRPPAVKDAVSRKRLSSRTLLLTRNCDMPAGWAPPMSRRLRRRRISSTGVVPWIAW